MLEVDQSQLKRHQRLRSANFSNQPHSLQKGTSHQTCQGANTTLSTQLDDFEGGPKILYNDEMPPP